MSKYIITGGRGFICSEICRQLLQKNETKEIIIIDNDYKGYGDRNISDLLSDERLEILDIDLTKPSFDDLWLISEHLKDTDFVISGAAVIGGIGLFNKIPATIIRDNNLINTTLLDLIIELPKEKYPRYVCMSSSMVYESAIDFPSKESDLPTTYIPKTAYGMSKLCGEYFCKAYAKQYGVPYTIVRPFNAIGPERPDPNMVGFSHVLPDLVLKIKNGQGTKLNPLEILGDGNQVRHYTHVKDIAEGIIACIHHSKSVNEDYNISTPYGHTVKDLAEIIWNNYISEVSGLAKYDLLGRVVFKHLPGFDADVQMRVPDTKKIHDLCGWQARYPLEGNIKEIIDAVKKLL